MFSYIVVKATVFCHISLWLSIPLLLHSVPNTCCDCLVYWWHLLPFVPQSFCCCTVTPVYCIFLYLTNVKICLILFSCHSQWIVLWAWIKSLVWQRLLLALHTRPRRACFVLLGNCTRNLSPNWWQLSETLIPTLFAASFQTTRRGYGLNTSFVLLAIFDLKITVWVLNRDLIQMHTVFLLSK